MEYLQLSENEEAKISHDFDFFIDHFDTVLKGTCERDLLRSIRKKMFAECDGERVSQAVGQYFALLGLVEENAVVQQRRKLESLNPEKIDASLRTTLQELKLKGFSAEDISKKLQQVFVQPVLTAHPTEAKRTTILEHHRKLYLCLVRLENTIWTPEERKIIEDEALELIDIIWRTGEIYHEKPDVESEHSNILYYLEKVFPAVMPLLLNRLYYAWKDVFGEDSKPPSMPRFRFASWVGGDRDGHPLVTAEHTKKFLKDFRKKGRKLLENKIQELASTLSLNQNYHKTPDAILKRLAELQKNNLPYSDFKNPEEPWRHFLNQMISHIQCEDTELYTIDDLLSDLELLARNLRESDGERLAANLVDPIIFLANTFPFTLAQLDIRQNSAFQEKAFLQLLEASNMEDHHKFAKLDDGEKLTWFTNELDATRPLILPSQSVGFEAEATRELYSVLHQELQLNSARDIGGLITSMTRNASDLLTVHILAREADLWVFEKEGHWLPFHVVPLFETIEDLEKAPSILREYLSIPYIQRCLKYLAQRENRTIPFLRVMVGYSDSNKDGGVVSSLVSLHQAERNILAIGKEFNIEIQFFHGRGGTISRGAGPMHRFLKMLPTGSLDAGLRLTEQGETIAQKYANKLTALHHLETMMSGVLEGCFQKVRPHYNELNSVLEQLTKAGYDSYRNLVTQKDFPQYFRDVTPVDILEHSRIGSRPARRTGAAGIEDLRAIPWSFSWGQNRILLSGWYGFGSAMNQIRQQDGELWNWLLKHWNEEPLLQYLVGNVGTVLTQVDLEIAAKYNELSSNPEFSKSIFRSIQEEYKLCLDIHQQLTNSSLSEDKVFVLKWMDRRKVGLEYLHSEQIKMLRQWRQQKSAADSPLLNKLLLNVNAIASGLGQTG